jgi:hypothetical protein
MGAVFEPLDPVDVAALADGIIAADDARAVDEPDTEPGLDSERPVLLEDERGDEPDPETGSDHGPGLEDTPDLKNQ